MTTYWPGGAYFSWSLAPKFVTLWYITNNHFGKKLYYSSHWRHMSVMVYQIICNSMVCSTTCSYYQKSKHQNTTLLPFVRTTDHRWIPCHGVIVSVNVQFQSNIDNRAVSQYKGRISKVWGSTLKIRRRDRLIFNMGIHILVRRPLVIETAPRTLTKAMLMIFILVLTVTTASHFIRYQPFGQNNGVAWVKTISIVSNASEIMQM